MIWTINTLRIVSCFLLIIGCGELLSRGNHLVAGTIKLRNSIVIDHDLITVGDIAEIQDFDPKTAEQLSQVTISPAPASGRELMISHDFIRRQLTVRGWNLSSLLIQGHSQVLVSRHAGTTNQMGKLSSQQIDQVNNQLTVAINKYYSQAGAEWENALVQLQLTPALAASLASISPPQIQVHGPAPVFNQIFTMNITYPVNNQQIEQSNMLVLLKPRPRVLAVKNTIPKGYLIQERDLIYVDTNKPEQGITDPRQVVGHESIRAIRSEEPIEPTYLRRNPLVRNQDIVTVYVKSASFSIQRQFKAKSEGAMGDTIQLVTLDNKELISARITGFKEAEIIPTGATDITPIPQGRQISLQPESPYILDNTQTVAHQPQFSEVTFQRYQRNSNPPADSQPQPINQFVAKPTVTSNQPLTLTR